MNLKVFSYCICRNAKTVARPLRRSKPAARHGTVGTKIFLKVSKRDLPDGLIPAIASNSPVLTDYWEGVVKNTRP